MTPEEIVPIGAGEYAAIESAFAELVGTTRDCVVVQGEAILPLEAVARGLGRAGSRALNVVTSPYGALFGTWLRQAGARVDDLVVDFDRGVAVEQVAGALARAGIDIVSIVHAEAASGVVNPLREIAELARGAGALVAVDAVASIGAEPLEIDAWDLDLTVVSAQKALAGPTGAAAVVVSDRTWEWLEANPAAPRQSILSLLDWKERWVDAGRTSLPVIPHHAEMRLLELALDRSLDEGLAAIVRRHVAARDACRSGLRALGLEPWVRDDAQAAAIATTVRPPAGVDVRALLEASGSGPLLSPAPAAPEAAVRVNHTGARASLAAVEEALAALGAGLQRLAAQPS